jgi:16S rRNA (guanine527-N7)-methyltransferase
MAVPSGPAWTALAEVYDRARAAGMLGDAPSAAVIDHAWSFVEALDGLTSTTAEPASVVDLGTGAGVPGLVVALARPDLVLTLVDRRTKRTDLLVRAVHRLELPDRVTVIAGDAEATLPDAGFEAAIARGFGPPDRTLALAARLVRPGGRIVISEPPSSDRWRRDWLDAAGVERLAGPVGVAVFARTG